MTKQDSDMVRAELKRTYIMYVFCAVILFLFWCFFFKDVMFSSIAITVFGGLAIICSMAFKINLYMDLIDKEKVVGVLKVTDKKIIKTFSEDGGGVRCYYLVKFSNWRIDDLSFSKEYYNKISIGDEFFIEITKNTELILKLKRENQDFKKGLIKKYPDTNRIDI